MGVHSGRFAVVDGVDTVRNWQITDTQSLTRYVASNTRGGAGRKRAVNEWSGAYAAYGGTPTHMPGDIFSFAGYGSPDNDVSGAGLTYSGQAIVDSIVVNWNWVAGEIINHVVNFSGHLALTTASATHTDVTNPDVPEVCGTKIEYVDTPNVEIPNLASATFTLSIENVEYVNSSTIVSGECWKGRKAGTPIDWTLAAVVDDNLRSGVFPAKGDDQELWLYVDATTYWQLRWGTVKDFTGINADRETGAILQQTINWEMNGFNPGVGLIRRPGDVADWWPV